jgi:hypothetical protein
MVRDGEHSPRVTLGQVAPLDERQHVVGKLQEPQAIRDGRLGLAHSLGQIAERELELVQQERVGASFLDRGELLSGHVLDETEQERVAVVGLAHEGRNRRQAGLLGGPPAPLAGNQLEPTGLARAHDDRLHETLRADRVGQRDRRLVVEPLAGLARVRMDCLDG